jgi:organic hydroperoxide reductase OsmC/OhrA
MSEHHAGVRWKKGAKDFTYETYERDHQIVLKQGAITLPGSSAPEFRGSADKPDPEEMLVLAMSQCHMLSFLAIAARKRIIVESYEDDAVGFLEKGPVAKPGIQKLWITRATLRPRVTFAGAVPDAETLAELHHLAHEECFIANSVRTEITVEPQA